MADHPAAPLAPGATIGILGSGQLGRMLATAAARLGFKTHVYDETSGPAFDVATRTTTGAFDDAAALATFARKVDVLTFEFENVPLAAAERLAPLVPLRPSCHALNVAQDRLIEKAFVAALGIPVAEYRRVDSAADAEAALADLAAPSILKTRRLGYDGKGQASLRPGEDVGAVWRSIGARPAVMEKRIEFEAEISALVVRGASGALAYYDCPVNRHKGGILRRSAVPSGLPDGDLEAAQTIAAKIADALGYVGVLAVEMFYAGARAPPRARLIVNEFAPRVHNSGHWTIEACGVSQFENHIRAVAGWPLGSTARHADAEMENLIGGEALAWAELAAEPGACLHLYGKRDARAGRKMGHITRLKPWPRPTR
jgi:5-(carboxyamino)imidazole ribonucleotide synthase